jgi:hypothetical protein
MRKDIMLICALLFPSFTFSQIQISDGKWKGQTKVPGTAHVELEFKKGRSFYYIIIAIAAVVASTALQSCKY